MKEALEHIWNMPETEFSVLILEIFLASLGIGIVVFAIIIWFVNRSRI